MDETYLPIYKQFEHVIRYIENETNINFKNARIGRIFHILLQLEDTFQIYVRLIHNSPGFCMTCYNSPGTIHIPTLNKEWKINTWLLNILRLKVSD